MFKDDGTPIKIPEGGFIPAKETSEIDKALQEFDAQSDNVPQAPVSQKKSGAENYSGMVSLIMKLSGGVIKTQRSAEYVLLIISFLSLGISFYLFFGGGNKSNPPSQTSIDQMKQVP